MDVYWFFNNGIILQWGSARYTNMASQAIFPISFTNLSYIIIPSGVIDDQSDLFIRGILHEHKTLSNCLFRTSSSGGPVAYWIAIGWN